MDVPMYPEISVKNLFEDAALDPEVNKYLPTMIQLSNKNPERPFFFGVLGTLRRDYLADVIQEAHSKRFKLPDDDPKRDSILISDRWMQELTKHPYYSSTY